MRLVLHVFGTQFDLDIGPIPTVPVDSDVYVGGTVIEMVEPADETERSYFTDDEEDSHGRQGRATAPRFTGFGFGAG